MNKHEFISKLKMALSGLPKQEIDDRVNFYSEMIDDKIEDGCSEQDVIAEIGSIEQVAKQIISDTPFSTLAKARITPTRSLASWEIILLILGAPIWLSLLISTIAIVVSIYVTLCTIIISLWAIFASLIACAAAGTLIGVPFAVIVNCPTGLSMLCAGLVCGGLGIFLFFGCKAATSGTIKLSNKIIFGIKKCLIKKEALSND